MQLSDNRKGILLAVLAAVLYAVSSPLSKLLLRYMGSVMMAGFLYLGAGVGMIFVALGSKFRHTAMTAQPFTVRQWPYILAMILLDIAAPVLLLAGLNLTTAENVSLLNNFEIVATAVIALLLFKEKISARLWTGIIFVLISCARAVGGKFYRVSVFLRFGIRVARLRVLGRGKQLHPKIVRQRSVAGGYIKRNIFRLGLSCNSTCSQSECVGGVGCICGNGGRTCRLRPQYLFLRQRSALYRSVAHQCLLCSVAFCRSSVVLYSVQANSSMDIFHCACSNGNGRMAVRFRQTCVCPSE